MKSDCKHKNIFRRKCYGDNLPCRAWDHSNSHSSCESRNSEINEKNTGSGWKATKTSTMNKEVLTACPIPKPKKMNSVGIRQKHRFANRSEMCKKRYANSTIIDETVTAIDCARTQELRSYNKREKERREKIISLLPTAIKGIPEIEILGASQAILPKTFNTKTYTSSSNKEIVPKPPISKPTNLSSARIRLRHRLSKQSDFHEINQKKKMESTVLDEMGTDITCPKNTEKCLSFVKSENKTRQQRKSLKPGLNMKKPIEKEERGANKAVLSASFNTNSDTLSLNEEITISPILNTANLSKVPKPRMKALSNQKVIHRVN